MRRTSRVRVSNRPLPSRIGAAEAERLLGVSRTTLHVLANSGKLLGRVVDKPGARRHWQFKLRDVLRLKQANNFVKYHKAHRIKKREAWETYFGNIPVGFTVACRDLDESNLERTNLCLLPLKVRHRLPHEMAQSVPGRRTRTLLSPDQVKSLKADFANVPTPELAAQLGCTVAALRARARRMKLRKSIDCIRSQARESHRLPVGTERVKEHTGLVWVKMSLTGSQYEQWRPKHHVIWEQSTGRKVPPRFCVMFKDGDKRNFDRTNLELMSKREMSARGFARYFSYPESLQAAIKLTRKLEREVKRQQRGEEAGRTARKILASQRSQARPRLWTTKMDVALRRKYPTSNLVELAAKLGVTFDSLRNRARRLHLRRSPETIIAEARAAAAHTLGEPDGQHPVHGH